MAATPKMNTKPASVVHGAIGDIEGMQDIITTARKYHDVSFLNCSQSSLGA